MLEQERRQKQLGVESERQQNSENTCTIGAGSHDNQASKHS